MNRDESPLVPRPGRELSTGGQGARVRREWKPRTPVSFLAAIGVAAAALVVFYREGQLTVGSFGFYFAIALCVGVVFYFLGHLAPTPESERSETPHPDPDVEAMVRGQIDAAEYARRKAAKGKLHDG